MRPSGSKDANGHSPGCMWPAMCIVPLANATAPGASCVVRLGPAAGMGPAADRQQHLAQPPGTLEVHRPQFSQRAAASVHPQAGPDRSPPTSCLSIAYLLVISSELSRCARRALRCSPRSSTRAKGIARREVAGPYTRAWKWQAHACGASRLPRAEQTWATRMLHGTGNRKKHHPVRDQEVGAYAALLCCHGMDCR
jgi:hypothetical protein